MAVLLLGVVLLFVVLADSNKCLLREHESWNCDRDVGASLRIVLGAISLADAVEDTVLISFSQPISCKARCMLMARRVLHASRSRATANACQERVEARSKQAQFRHWLQLEDSKSSQSVRFMNITVIARVLRTIETESTRLACS